MWNFFIMILVIDYLRLYSIIKRVHFPKAKKFFFLIPNIKYLIKTFLNFLFLVGNI